MCITLRSVECRLSAISPLRARLIVQYLVLMSDMTNELLEVVDLLVEVGVQREVAVNAVECVCRTDVPIATNYMYALAFIDKDWEVLAPLYTAICTQFLMNAGYIIQGMYFTEDDRFCAFYVVVFKNDLPSGSRVYGVKRTFGRQDGGCGLNGYNLLQQL